MLKIKDHISIIVHKINRVLIIMVETLAIIMPTRSSKGKRHIIKRINKTMKIMMKNSMKIPKGKIPEPINTNITMRHSSNGRN